MIKNSDLKNLEQLALGLDLPEPEDESGLSYAEVQRTSLDAMQALDARITTPSEARSTSRESTSRESTSREDGEGQTSVSDPTWLMDYLRLKELGFSWRVAAYIAWEASPKMERQPGSITELATEVLGLKSPRVIYTWRKKNPSIDEIVSVMQTAPLYEHRRDVIEALIAVASDPDYKGHSDRKLFFEMIGDYVPRSQVDLGKKKLSGDDLSGLSDEELRQLTERMKDKEADRSQLTADGEPTSPDVGTSPKNLDGSRLETNTLTGAGDQVPETGETPPSADASGASSHERGAPRG